MAGRKDAAVRLAKSRRKAEKAVARYRTDLIEGSFGGAGFGVGGYDGGRFDRTSLSTWRTRQVSSNQALLPDLPTLRARSADLVRNTPVARGAVATVVTNVVGTGLQARPRIDADALGITDDEANDIQKEFDREWCLWAYSAECDIARTLTFDGLQEVALRAVLVDGDAFAVKRFHERPGSPFGTKVQLVEAMRVSNPDFQSDTAAIRAGIEIDENGAPVAYQMASGIPGETLAGAPTLTWFRTPAFGARTGFRQVLHLYRPSAINVLRGEPMLAPVIEALKQLSRYTEAELYAAVINSCFAVTTKTTNADGLDLAPSGKTDSKGDDIVLGKPGTIVDLGLDEEIEGFTPGRPSAAFDPFVTSIISQIGMAIEIPYEVLIKHFDSSYSAARAALLDATKMFMSRRDWLAQRFCQPFYEMVIMESVARGRLTAPGIGAIFRDDGARAAFLGCDWIGPSPGTIDPVHEVEALKVAVEEGFLTRAQATISLNGGDWESNLPVRVREEKARAAGGLIIPPEKLLQPAGTPSDEPGGVPVQVPGAPAPPARQTLPAKPAKPAKPSR